MVEYWHWHSLHYGQETYWKGVLSHDLLPNRTYREVSQVANELKRVGPRLVDLKSDNHVAILVSTDSANAISYMPFADNVDYQSILRQMYGALYELNVEPDFVAADDADLSKYKVLLVPPLYSASDAVLKRLSDYVSAGGRVVMAFKSGFTDEHSTVRAEMAPGPLRAAAGFHYQEFSNLASPRSLEPDAFKVADENKGAIWQEFIVPDTAKTIESFTGRYFAYPAITRNDYGKGTLVYEATVVTPALQREIIRDTLERAGLTGADQKLPSAVKVRHGRNAKGEMLHYYLNFSGSEQEFTYPYADGADILSGERVARNQQRKLKPWDLVIVAEAK